MAKKGYRVQVLEAHERFGGYGHTFTQGEYKFNAHLHYVVGCGEHGGVHTVLKKLELDNSILFTRLNEQSYDRIFCEDQLLKIAYTLDQLEENMKALDTRPESGAAITRFINILKTFSRVTDKFPRHLKHSYRLLPVLPDILKLWRYKNATLESVFDTCELPPLLQTLVSINS